MNRQNNPRNIYLIFGGYLNYRLKVIRLLLFQQVWSQALRSLVALLHLPILYFCLVAAEQYVGHFPAFVFCRLLSQHLDGGEGEEAFRRG